MLAYGSRRHPSRYRDRWASSRPSPGHRPLCLSRLDCLVWTDLISPGRSPPACRSVPPAIRSNGFRAPRVAPSNGGTSAGSRTGGHPALRSGCGFCPLGRKLSDLSINDAPTPETAAASPAGRATIHTPAWRDRPPSGAQGGQVCGCQMVASPAAVGSPGAVRAKRLHLPLRDGAARVQGGPFGVPFVAVWPGSYALLAPWRVTSRFPARPRQALSVSRPGQPAHAVPCYALPASYRLPLRLDNTRTRNGAGRDPARRPPSPPERRGPSLSRPLPAPASRP